MTINYLDRQIIGLLKEDYLEPIFGWGELDYAHIVIAFQVAYAFGMVGAGILIDRLGTRYGYAITLVVWSIACFGNAIASGLTGFIIARAILGLTIAGNLPAAVKSIAEWFPIRERAFAAGILSSGANVGAIIAPIAVPLISVSIGWRWSFVLPGLIGLICLVLWILYYEKPARHKKISDEEYHYIHSDEAVIPNKNSVENRVNWFHLFRYRQTWAFAVLKFFSDPVWWFLLFWLPSFLNNEYGMSKLQLVFPLTVVYLMSLLGSISGGWLSGYFLHRGWSLYRARRTALLLFAILLLPMIFAQVLGHINLWFAIFIIGVATAAHQAWSATNLTTVTDMFPKRAVASVVGIGGMVGAVGGVLLSGTAGLILEHFSALGKIQTGYYIMFVICSLAYLVAWIIFSLLVPKMPKVEI